MAPDSRRHARGRVYACPVSDGAQEGSCNGGLLRALPGFMKLRAQFALGGVRRGLEGNIRAMKRKILRSLK